MLNTSVASKCCLKPELFMSTNIHSENLAVMNRKKMVELKVTFQSDSVPWDTWKCSNSQSKQLLENQESDLYMSRASLALELKRALLRSQPVLRSKPKVYAKWCTDAACVSLLGPELASSCRAVQVCTKQSGNCTRSSPEMDRGRHCFPLGIRRLI